MADVDMIYWPNSDLRFAYAEGARLVILPLTCGMTSLAVMLPVIGYVSLRVGFTLF
jgi:hypothetical protein